MASRVTTTQLLPSPSSARHMATAVPPKKPYFLVILPDKPGSIDRRMQVRPVHLKEIYPKVENGDIKIGGPLFRQMPKDTDSKPDIYGSCVIWSAESKEEVLDALKKDIYVKDDVWDFEKVQIFSFVPTFNHQFDKQ